MTTEPVCRWPIRTGDGSTVLNLAVYFPNYFRNATGGDQAVVKDNRLGFVVDVSESTQDEWYAHWFACPACRGDRAGDGGPSGRRVARDFRFCPDCGVALLWPEGT